MASQNLNSVLTAFPALTSTVVRSNATTLSTDIAQIANFNNQEVLALSIVALTYVLAHAGGVDYRSNHPQLNTDAQTFMGAFSWVANRRPGDLLDKMDAVIDWNRAFDLDATITTNINTIITAMKRFQDHSDGDLRMHIIYLRYACSIKGV